MSHDETSQDQQESDDDNTRHEHARVLASAMASLTSRLDTPAAQRRRDPGSPLMAHSKDLPSSPLVTPPGARAVSSATGREPVAGFHQQQQDSPGAAEKRGVPHIYHDYSQVPDVIGYVRKKTGGVTQPFPEKLHEMLHDLEGDVEASRLVSWLPHGRAFLVHKPKDFTRDIMPKFFRQTKLTSFQRQLNLYGFRRITQGTDAGAYYHEMFLRNRPGLCQRMVRQKVKGTGHKQPADASSEPNFYNMPSLDYYQTSTARAMPSSLDSGPGESQITVLSPPAAASPPVAPVPDAVRYPAHGFVLGSSATIDSPGSPGMRSVRGAAHLLQGIASGRPMPRLPPTSANRDFLGQSAGSAKTQSKARQDQETSPRLQPKSGKTGFRSDAQPET